MCFIEPQETFANIWKITGNLDSWTAVFFFLKKIHQLETLLKHQGISQLLFEKWYEFLCFPRQFWVAGKNPWPPGNSKKRPPWPMCVACWPRFVWGTRAGGRLFWDFRKTSPRRELNEGLSQLVSKLGGDFNFFNISFLLGEDFQFD